MTEETIFAAALEKQTPAERSAFLDEACAKDKSLRQRLEILIACHERAVEFLEKPALEQIAAGIAHAKDDAAATDGIRQVEQGIAQTPVHAPSGETQAEPAHEDEDGYSLDFLAPSERSDALGRIGHYHVLAVIGRGGMGVVLKAFDEELQRVVAIKVMAPQLALPGMARKRFRREAQAAAAVRDEHVIDIHAVEEINGLPYLVMEYISGISLQDRLDQSGPLDLKEILRIGMQTAAGLAKAHAQGLIHRDIKPANILLENGVQRVKITDFGLARAVDDASLTQSGVIAGTPQYMAPEQARGEAVDHRADLFSLGSVLYAMCTGHPPFRANSAMAVLKRVCEEASRPIRETNPEIPDWLCAIIDKLHAKDPAQRFQSAQEVAELLGQHLAHLQQPALVPRPPRVIGHVLAPPRQGSRAAVWVLVAVGLFFILGFCCVLPVAWLLGFSYLQVSQDSQAPEPQVLDELAPAPGGGREFLPKGNAPTLIRQAPTALSLPGHTSMVWCVAWAPDGQTLASASQDKTVRIWRREGGGWQLKQVLEAHPGGARSAAFSRNGSILATGGHDGTVKLWQWDGIRFHEGRTLRGHKHPIHAVAFAPDGRLASGGGPWPQKGPGEVKVWDVRTGEELASLPPHDVHVNALTFSPDSKLLATASADFTVKLWDTASWKPVASLEHADGVNSVAFARDGNLLAAGTGDHTITLWKRNGERWPKHKTFIGHTDAVWPVAFHPNGNVLASGSYDKTIRLWDVATAKELATLRGHTGRVWALAFAPDGKTLAAGGDNAVNLWDVSHWVSPPRTQAVASTPFVILGRADKADRCFPTLIEAVANSKAGDTIEVRGDGPFWIHAAGVPIHHALTIRAGAGCRPVFKLAQVQPGQGRNKHLLDIYASITLEGLDFDRTGEHEGTTRERAALYVQNGSLHMTNCRLLTGGLAHYLLWLRHVHEADIRNCLFTGPALQAICVAECSDDDRLALTNCIFAGISRAILTEEQGKPASSLRVRLVGNTFSALPLSWNHSSSRELRVEARDNVVTGPGVIDFLHFPRVQSWKELAAAVRWEGKRNLYLAGRSPVLIDWKPTTVLAELDGWKAGTPQFQGGDDRGSQAAMQKSEFWRLAANSPGKGAGENGRDLGADVDRVGSGAAYERWKKTPEYQQWLKANK